MYSKLNCYVNIDSDFVLSIMYVRSTIVGICIFTNYFKRVAVYGSSTDFFEFKTTSFLDLKIACWYISYL